MAESTQENLDHSSNPTVKALVESVGSHASDSDKDTLAELISFGDKWKVEGEKMEKEWWLDQQVRSHSVRRKLFCERCTNFDQLKKTRKEKEEENLKALFSSEMMKGYLLDKYIEEYLYKWILYYPSEMDEEVVEGDINDVVGYDSVLAYLRAGNMEPGVVIALRGSKMGDQRVKEIVEAIKEVGLAPGVGIDLCRNEIGPEGAKYIAETIKESGLASGVVIDLSWNNIGDNGAKAIAEAIKEVGLEPGVVVDLRWNHIWDAGANYILEAIKQKGLPSGATIDLSENNLSPKIKEQLSELNKTVQGEIVF